MKLKNDKGIMLIEAMVATFVLALILMASIAVAATYLKDRSALKSYQQSVEEMSIVINEMAKKIRMSNCDDETCSFSSSSITVYENESGNELKYTFDNANKQLVDGNGTVIMSKVNGIFTVVPASPSGREIPRITVTVWKTDYNANIMQTTVSMRSGYSPPNN